VNDAMKDLLIRAAKTFAQSFLAALAVGIVAVDDFAGLQALAIASAAAALSAVMNLIIGKK